MGHAPFFQQTRTFLIAVRDSGGIKLTAKGNLPRSFVNTMIDVFLNAEEKVQTLSVCKVLNEQDLLPLHEAHILGKLSGQIGRLKGQLKLRKNALKLLHPESAGLLYKILFIEPFEKWGLLEVERAKGKYFDEIQRIRKTPLFDAFIRYEA